MMKCSTCCTACAAERHFILLPTTLLRVSTSQIPRALPPVLTSCQCPMPQICCQLQHHLPLATPFSTTCILYLLYSLFTAHSASELVVTCSHVGACSNLILLCIGVKSILPLHSWLLC